MNCPMCGGERRRPGATTVTLTRGDATIVFRDVPADICDGCGEDALKSDVAQELERLAAAAIAAGVQYEVRTYRAAA